MSSNITWKGWLARVSLRDIFFLDLKKFFGLSTTCACFSNKINNSRQNTLKCTYFKNKKKCLIAMVSVTSETTWNNKSGSYSLTFFTESKNV